MFNIKNYFEYKIYESVYNEIISGRKTTEFRLLNDKTDKIDIGDKIKFKILDNENKFIIVKVLKKYIYDDIDDLWKHKEMLSNVINYTKEEFTTALYEIFGEEEVKTSKIVGINFEITRIV